LLLLQAAQRCTAVTVLLEPYTLSLSTQKNQASTSFELNMCISPFQPGKLPWKTTLPENTGPKRAPMYLRLRFKILLILLGFKMHLW
jgi:hypothetical protein